VNRDEIRCTRREIKIPRTRHESGGHDPGGCAYDAQPFILPLDRVELELEELGNVPYERQDLSYTVVDGRHCREEVDDRP